MSVKILFFKKILFLLFLLLIPNLYGDTKQFSKNILVETKSDPFTDENSVSLLVVGFAQDNKDKRALLYLIQTKDKQSCLVLMLSEPLKNASNSKKMQVKIRFDSEKVFIETSPIWGSTGNGGIFIREGLGDFVANFKKHEKMILKISFEGADSDIFEFDLKEFNEAYKFYLEELKK